MRTAAFCFVCGSKTRMAYPGNDPENGPATRRCQKDPEHESLDEVEDDVAQKAGPDIIDNFLKELTLRQRHTALTQGPQYVAIPLAVNLAAQVLLQDLESQEHAEEHAQAQAGEHADAVKYLARRVADLVLQNG
jgi:hypothetical protein